MTNFSFNDPTIQESQQILAIKISFFFLLRFTLDYNAHQTAFSGCGNTIKYNKNTKKHNVWDKFGQKKKKTPKHPKGKKDSQ